jgi:DNA primase
MPHFSESEIEEVKRLNRLEDVARAAGCELKKHGTNKLVTLCPFHSEKSPSCVIDRVRNTFKCFGCGKGGDVISWVMETEGRDFVAAVEKLAQGTGIRGQGSGERGQNTFNHSRKSSVRTEQLFDPEMTGEEMLERTARYYHEVGLESGELREYLVKRGLLPKDADEEFLNAPDSILNFFKLGYANRTLGLKVEKGDRVGGAEVRRKLQEIGVVRASGGR